MANRIQLRRDTTANWERVDPILEDGEPGLDITTNQIKYGDGSSPWTLLPYASSGTSGNTSPGNAITNTDSVTEFSVTVANTGVISMTTARGGLEFGAMPEVGGPQHLHIMRPAGQNGSTDLFFGDDYNYVKMPGLYGAGTQGVEIGSSYDLGTVSVWRFDTAGNINLPNGGKIGAIEDPNGIDLFANDTMNWAQLNWNNQNFVYVDSVGAHLQAGTTQPGEYEVVLGTDGVTTVPGRIQGTTTTVTIDSITGINSYDGSAGSNYIWFSGNGSFTQLYNLGSAAVGWKMWGQGGENNKATITAIDTSLGAPTIHLDGPIYGNAPLTAANLQVQTNPIILGSSTTNWTFDTDGNLTTAGNVIIGTGYGNISMVDTISANNYVYANGVSILSGIGSSYGNTEVATYMASGSLETAWVHGNLTVGNLIVNGNTTTINTSSYVVSDNIVQFADQNPADTLDVGFVAHRTVNSTLQHTGLVRDASAGNWKLFSNIATQPGNTVDFTGVVYDDLVVGNISSPTIDTITANLGSVSDSLTTLTANAGAQAVTIASLTNYSNVNAQAYLSGSVTGIVPASAYSNELGSSSKPWGSFYTYNMELAGGYLKTGGTGGISGQVLKSTGSVNPPAWSNVADIISGSTGNFTFPANVTVTGNVVANTIVGAVTNSNTTITAGSYTSTFDTAGNVSLPGNVTVGGMGVVMPTRPAFRVYGSGTTSSLSTTQNTDGKLTSANFAQDFQQGTALTLATGIFTAPIAGLYQVNLSARTSGAATSSNQLAVVKNYAGSSSIAVMIEFGASSSMAHTGASTVIKLAVGDTLVIKVLAGTINFDANDSWSVAYIG